MAKQQWCEISGHAQDRFQEWYDPEGRQTTTERLLEIRRRLAAASPLAGPDLRIVQQSCPYHTYYLRQKKHTYYWRDSATNTVFAAVQLGKKKYRIVTLFPFGSKPRALPSYQCLDYCDGRPSLQHEELDRLEHEILRNTKTSYRAKMTVLIAQARLAIEQNEAARLARPLVSYARGLRELVERLPHHETCGFWRVQMPSLESCTCGKFAALRAHCPLISSALRLTDSHEHARPEEGPDCGSGRVTAYDSPAPLSPVADADALPAAERSPAAGD